MELILIDSERLRKQIKSKEREIDSPVITMHTLAALDELIETVQEVVDEV